MKKFVGIIFSFIFLSPYNYAQVSLDDVVIEPNIINLGTIAEEKGPVFAKFKFRVKGKNPLNLRNVTAGCGCTNVIFTPGVYHPGDSGIVKLTFNPSGLSGPVTREIWMEGNFKIAPGAIGKSVFLEAVVFSKLMNTDGTQKYIESRGLKPGDLTLSRDQLYFGVHQPNFVRTDTIFVKNNSTTKTYKVMGIDRNPQFLTMKNAPIDLAPGDSIPLHIQMNLDRKDTFGELYGRFRILTDDKSFKFKEIVYYVRIDPVLGTPTKKSLKKAPKITAKNTEIDFGTMKTGGTATKFIEIKNEGKSTLNIWRVDTDCVCVKLNQSKFEIPPGETQIIEVTFDSVLKNGLQNRGIKLYTNDPLNKEFNLLVKANIPN